MWVVNLVVEPPTTLVGKHFIGTLSNTFGLVDIMLGTDRKLP